MAGSIRWVAWTNRISLTFFSSQEVTDLLADDAIKDRKETKRVANWRQVGDGSNEWSDVSFVLVNKSTQVDDFGHSIKKKTKTRRHFGVCGCVCFA
jgi:hypothetical protein